MVSHQASIRLGKLAAYLRDKVFMYSYGHLQAVALMRSRKYTPNSGYEVFDHPVHSVKAFLAHFWVLFKLNRKRKYTS